MSQEKQVTGVHFRAEFIPNNSKTHIYTGTWEPSEFPIKANVVFVHSYAEHITRYDGVFKRFASEGIKIHGFDQVGCGKTGERANDLGGALGLSRVLLDITDAIDRVHDPEVPLFLMGHSFGGACCLNYLAMGDRKALIHGTIALSPCLQVSDESRPFFPIQMLLDQMSSIFPTLKFPVHLDAKYLSRKIEEVRNYVADPNIFARSSLIQLRDVLYEGGAFMKSRYAKVQVSRLLIVHGTEDKISCPKASATTYQKLKENGKIPYLEFKPYDGGYHELLNDVCRDEVSADLMSWISKHI
ncbi:hypothetical protein DSO57_1011569 [Entomophthora muscae]|uniref:Uncharacterized protein n=1 Tax=Entomophthora muscae TaxID=34485 RepID=A0ACC2SV38_9FUNG|nr:hypothetical protein DSO57_1011569 [Entomophthora muscae]